MYAERERELVQKKVAIVTGGRSDFGLLEPLIEAVDNEFELQLIATGSHFSYQFGYTCKNIKWKYHKAEILMDSDTPTGTTKSMGMALITFSDLFSRLRPDLLMVLGDRWEILAASIAAYNARIPIAHLQGGDTTKGSLDDGYRDCITRMGDFHFVATLDAYWNVFDLVQDVEKIRTIGSLGCVMPELETKKSEFLHDIVAVWHPYKGEYEKEFCNLFTAIRDVVYDDEFTNKYGIISSNCDAGGRNLNRGNYVNGSGRCLERHRYLGLLKNAKVLVGNSSSGIIEAPCVKTPTVNVGNRQKGRVCGDSVFHCKGEVEDIKAAIKAALEYKGDFGNPYYQPNTIENIIKYIKEFMA
jgi:GDP/UDP-N,N'-diacetylbacillosamine 2-epimerase (hydrolysing)